VTGLHRLFLVRNDAFITPDDFVVEFTSFTFMARQKLLTDVNLLPFNFGWSSRGTHPARICRLTLPAVVRVKCSFRPLQPAEKQHGGFYSPRQNGSGELCRLHFKGFRFVAR
jgi:hypothetical protein